MSDVIDQINNHLIRLGYSSFSGDAHGYEACPDGDPTLAIMGHPTKQFDVAAYDAAALLAALQALPEGTDWSTLQQTLQSTMVG